MKIVFDIPKEFESHFEFDRFADSLARVASDIDALGFKMSGRYERETITMIRKAFENATPLPKGHGRLIDADKIEWFGCNFEGRACIESKGDCSVCNYADCYAKQVRELPTIIEADEEGSDTDAVN